jgi:protein tyrosine/serine phosphatase
MSKAGLSALALTLAAICLYARTVRPQVPTQSQQGPTGKTAGCITSTTAAEAALRLDLHGVPNFGKVTATLYRGGQPSRDGFDELKKLGMQIVVNLRDDNSEIERSAVTAAGLEYVAIPWNCRHPANSQAAKFLQILRENPEKKVFVHCHAGVDRTGLMIAVYRMTEQGWTSEQASDEMKDFGFNFLHRSWCHALEDYEQNFPQQLTADPGFRPFLKPQSASACTP